MGAESVDRREGRAYPLSMNTMMDNIYVIKMDRVVCAARILSWAQARYPTAVINIIQNELNVAVQDLDSWTTVSFDHKAGLEEILLISGEKPGSPKDK